MEINSNILELDIFWKTLDFFSLNLHEKGGPDVASKFPLLGNHLL